eukprot:4738940-Prymnesium_polylepis.1
MTFGSRHRLSWGRAAGRRAHVMRTERARTAPPNKHVPYPGDPSPRDTRRLAWANESHWRGGDRSPSR